MDTSVFIALTNPGMSLVFAATFFLLWNHRREHRYILKLAIGYLALSVGFLCQYFQFPFGLIGSRIVSNVAFLAGAVLIAAGCLERYQIKPPLTVILSVAGAGLAVFMWFLFIVPDLTWRILVINFTFGAITLIIAVELRNIPNPRPIDRLLFGIFLFWGIMFFPRPLITAWIEGPYVSYEGFYDSLYWITMTFSASLFLLVSTLTLISGIALDVIEELRTLSHTDPLSGLLNRRGFEARAADLLDRSAGSAPSALVVADLDHFKSINDTLGHATGDRLIACFGAQLERAAAHGAIAGRIGGEEFAVLLPASDAAAARLFAEGVRVAFSDASGAECEGDARVSASFGVAGWSPGETLSGLMQRADRALYAAKEAGRDCVRTFEPAGELFSRADNRRSAGL